MAMSSRVLKSTRKCRWRIPPEFSHGDRFRNVQIPCRGGACPARPQHLAKSCSAWRSRKWADRVDCQDGVALPAPLQRYGLVCRGADAHTVERAVDEEEGDGEKDGREDVC